MAEFDHRRRKGSTLPASSGAEKATASEGSARLDGALIQRTINSPNLLSPSDVLRLQRAVGNRAVQRILSGRSSARLGLVAGEGVRGADVNSSPADVQRSEIPVRPEVMKQNGPTVIQREVSKLRELDTYLDDKKYIPHFKKYTAKKKVMESYDFLLAVRKFRKHPTLAKVDDIFARYIAKGAVQVNNLPQTAYQETMDEIVQAKAEIAKLESAPMKKKEIAELKEIRLRTVFDKAYKHIRHMMERDTMGPAFYGSQEFQDIQDTRSSWFGNKMWMRGKGKDKSKEARGPIKQKYVDKHYAQVPEEHNDFADFLDSF